MNDFLRQLLRWTLGSGVSFSVNIGTAVLLHEVFAVRTEYAVAVAYFATWVTNYFLQRYVIFDARGHDWRKQALQFLATSIAFRLVEYGLFLLLHSVAGMPYFVAQILIAGLGFVGKFFFYRRFVFGPRDGGSTVVEPLLVEGEQSGAAVDDEESISDHTGRGEELGTDLR